MKGKFKIYIRSRIKKELGDDLNSKGIYMFWFKGKENYCYIGSTQNSFFIRFCQHISSFKDGKCKRKIDLIVNDSIINGFQFKILMKLNQDSTHLLQLFELFYIKKLKPKLNTVTNYYTLENMEKLLNRNWTEKMSELEIDNEFMAHLSDYTTLNSTRQRMKYKYPERVFSILKNESDLIKVKRTS